MTFEVRRPNFNIALASRQQSLSNVGLIKSKSDSRIIGVLNFNLISKKEENRFLSEFTHINKKFYNGNLSLCILSEYISDNHFGIATPNLKLSDKIKAIARYYAPFGSLPEWWTT